MEEIDYFNLKDINKNNISKYDEIKEFICKNTDESWNRIYRLGYENFGILLVGFCTWIHENIKKREISQIVFLARDGFIVKKVYEILYPEEATKYLYVSRRSLSLPSIHLKDGVDEILDCIVLPPVFDVQTFLECFNIQMDEVREELYQFEISDKILFKRSEYRKNEKIIGFVSSILYKIKEKSKVQYENFMQYIEQMHISGKIAVVDIGWHNSIQNNLIQIIGNEITIHGFYLGVYDNAKIIKKPHSAEGYLYNFGDNMKRQIKTFSFVSLLESMFLAHEGTTIAYMTEEHKVSPVIAKYEYENNSYMMDIIKCFQEGAIKFVYDYKNSNFIKEMISQDIASGGIINLGCNPKEQDLEVFESIDFENYRIGNIVNFNYKSVYYFCHPKMMKKDFFQSGWRIVFLRKLFKIPLPYNFLFGCICKIFNRG